jgi:hypothetical protein
MSSGGVPSSRDWGRRAFSPKRRRSIAAVAEAILSDEDDQGQVVAPPREITDRVADELDLLIGAGSSDLSRGFRILAWLIEWLPLVMIGAFSRASRLPLARRVRYLEELEHAKIALLATLLVAFRLPIIMIAFEVDPLLRLTGFDRETIATPRLTGPVLKVIGQ